MNATKLQEVRKSNAVTVCKNYIYHNDELKKRKIHMQEDITGAQIAWVSKLVQFSHSKIFSEGRKLEILQCPVTFAGAYLYLWPVHYIKTGKAAQVFTFKEVGRNTGKVIPFILSPVNEGHFEKSTDVSQTNRDKAEKIIGKISSPDKVGPSSHHPLSNLIDLQNTETNIDPAKVEYNSHHLIQDLIDFTDPLPESNDFSGGIPVQWEKFD